MFIRVETRGLPPLLDDESLFVAGSNLTLETLKSVTK